MLLFCSFILEIVVLHDQQWDCFKVVFQLDFFFPRLFKFQCGNGTRTSHKQKGQVTPSKSLTFSMAQLALLAFPHTCLHCKRDDHVNITKPGICTSAAAAEALTCSQCLAVTLSPQPGSATCVFSPHPGCHCQAHNNTEIQQLGTRAPSWEKCYGSVSSAETQSIRRSCLCASVQRRPWELSQVL